MLHYVVTAEVIRLASGSNHQVIITVTTGGGYYFILVRDDLLCPGKQEFQVGRALEDFSEGK